MARLSELYGRLLTGLAVVAAVLLFAMMIIICLDVALRNLPVPRGIRGIYWSNDVTESMLYLLTILCAPWLLRRGQHIRVDIVLRAVPKMIAWYLEWLADVCVLICCLLMALYGFLGMFESKAAGSLTIRAVVTPEWWSLAPLPVAFVLLAGEVIFRMYRLYLSERAPRHDSIAAS